MPSTERAAEMQHLQYGNYDIRYIVHVRKMADIKLYCECTGSNVSL